MSVGLNKNKVNARLMSVKFTNIADAGHPAINTHDNNTHVNIITCT